MSDSLRPPWTAARQAPLSVKFPRQEYWSGLPCSPPGDCSDPGMEPGSPTLKADSFRLGHQRSPAVPSPLSNAVRPLDLKLSFASSVFPVMLFVPWTWSSRVHHVFFPSSQMVTTAPAAGKRTVPQVASPETEPGEWPPPQPPGCTRAATGKALVPLRLSPCLALSPAGFWPRKSSVAVGEEQELTVMRASSPQSSEAGRHPWVHAPVLCSRHWTALGRRPPSLVSPVRGQPRAPRWEPRRQVRRWRSAGGAGSRF